MSLWLPVQNTEIVSVELTPTGGNTNTSYKFPTPEELFDHLIVAVEVFADVDMAFDPNNSGNTPPSTPIFNAAFLTLYTSSVPAIKDEASTQQPGLWYDKVPFSSMRRVQNNDITLTPLPSFSKDLFRIRPTFLVFNKCKVEFPTGVAIGNNVSAVVMFHYLDKNVSKDIIKLYGGN